jgi:hypothetical protein
MGHLQVVLSPFMLVSRQLGGISAVTSESLRTISRRGCGHAPNVVPSNSSFIHNDGIVEMLLDREQEENKKWNWKKESNCRAPINS